MEAKLFERTAKVLFFATLDEAFAVKYAEEISKNAKNELEALDLIHEKISKSHNKNHKVEPIKGHFSFPIGVDISHWREFRLNASKEDFDAVLLKWIGRFNDPDIIRTIEVSDGTLKSRYNNGLRSLGALLIKEHS